MICESPIVRWTAKEQVAHSHLVDGAFYPASPNLK